jgi:acyl-CoA reductase-like NAD-dependent aldehyde dehydrogenase
MKPVLISLLEPLNKLSASEQMVLEKIMQPVSFSVGTYIFKEGSFADSCYILEEGIVRIETASENSSNFVVNYLGAGTIFGEISLLDKMPRSATAYAQTNIIAKKILIQELEILLETSPRILICLWEMFRKAAALGVRSLNELTIKKNHFAINPEVEVMLDKALLAQKEIQTWSEERIDTLLLVIASSIAEHAESLATATVKATRVGDVSDKVTKNKIASLGIYRSLVGKSGCGFISNNKINNVCEIASPVGIIFGMIPMTNPVATAVFKALICIKSRNALILSFPLSTKNVGTLVCEIIQEALIRQDAPVELIQWLKHRSSREQTEILMKHKNVSLILATGGASMVKAAYSSGTPAIGVGPANTPTLICADANIQHAARSIIVSKSFDNGLICGSEHNLIVDARVRKNFIKVLEQEGAAILTHEEKSYFSTVAFEDKSNRLQAKIIGQSAAKIAVMANIKRDYPIKLIIVPNEFVSLDNPYAYEKMAPIVSLFTVKNEIEGIELCRSILQIEGKGHTAIIHTKNKAVVRRFGLEMPASRILVNSPGVHGIIGFTSALDPSFTLGCGTFGGNSTTDNVTYSNLLNLKRVAYYQAPKFLDPEIFKNTYPQWLLQLLNLLNFLKLNALVTFISQRVSIQLRR